MAASVGTSPGAAGVSANGAAGYVLPIRPTEGIGAMTPRLAVEYVGPGRRTILGVGFGIAGISYITPCRLTIAQDLNAAPVTLTAADRYCLDGAKLRLVSGGTYGASGTTYRTEIDQIALVTANASANNIPGWFEVKTRDGLTYEYGRNADAKLLASAGASAAQFWAVNKISDRDGNSIYFQYTTDAATRTFQPSFIRYTDRPGEPGHYRINFVYETVNRPDPVFTVTPSATGGAAHQELKRLAELRLVHDSSVYRKYLFNYNAGAGTNSRLASVQECVPGAPDDCFPATSFGWQDATAGYQALVEPTASASSIILPLDLNGDGFEDVVWAESGSWRYRLGGASGYGAKVSTGITATNPGSAMTLEWNGDGYDDLLVDWTDGKWRVLQGSSSGLLGPVQAGYNGGQVPSNLASMSWAIVDANSDGLDDLVRMATNNAFLQIHLRLNTRVGSFVGFGSEALAYATVDMKTQNVGFIKDSGASRVRRPDLNGDGRTDLLVYACEWEHFPIDMCGWSGWFLFLSDGATYEISAALENATYALDVRFGDFNADGLTDLVYPAQSLDVWYLGYGQGGGGVALSSGPSSIGYATYQTLTGDYDGDGYDDLLATRNNEWDVIRGTGTGLSTTALPTGISGSGIAWMQTDLNGDSLADLGRFNTNNSRWGSFSHAGLPGDRLVSITDGLQNVTTFAYLPMSDTTVYAKGATALYPDRDVGGSVPLVRSLTRSPAGAVAYSTDYKYGGARVNPQGRGFLGMGTREVTDNRNGIFSTTTFRQDFPYIGAPDTVTVKQSTAQNAQPIQVQTHTYDKHILDASGSNSRYLPYRDTTVTVRKEVGGPRDGADITQVTEDHTVN
jgi:hypothetical protein